MLNAFKGTVNDPMILARNPNLTGSSLNLTNFCFCKNKKQNKTHTGHLEKQSLPMKIPVTHNQGQSLRFEIVCSQTACAIAQIRANGRTTKTMRNTTPRKSTIGILKICWSNNNNQRHNERKPNQRLPTKTMMMMNCRRSKRNQSDQSELNQRMYILHNSALRLLFLA
jgi:hypothetical protein